MATDAERNRGAGAYSTPGVDTRQAPAPAPIITSSPSVTFKLVDVAPPSQVYVTENDQLAINVRNSLVGQSVIIRTRILRKDGVIQYSEDTFAVTSDRSANVFALNLTEGYLLGVECSETVATFFRGQTFVQILLKHGGITSSRSFQPLVSGYLVTQNWLGWPGSNMISALEGPGWPRTIAGTTPAAGAEINEVVPTGARWRFISFDYALVTSAAVANRETVLLTSDGTTVSARIPSGFTQAAAITHEYDFFPGSTRYEGTQATVTVAGFPPSYILAGGRIFTSTANLQAADQYQTVRYQVEEWIEN